MFVSTSVTGCGGFPGVPIASQGFASFIARIALIGRMRRRPGPREGAGNPLPVARTPSMKMPGAPPWMVWSIEIQLPCASATTMWLLPTVATTLAPGTGASSVFAARLTFGMVCFTNSAIIRP